MSRPEPVQLRGSGIGSPLLVVRGGVNALNDDIIRRASALTRAKWGFDGISVFEAPDGDLGELSRRIRAMAERPTIRTAQGAALRGAGFPLFDTGAALHWTIVFADTEPASLDRLRSIFSPPINNPGYQHRRPS